MEAFKVGGGGGGFILGGGDYTDTGLSVAEARTMKKSPAIAASTGVGFCSSEYEVKCLDKLRGTPPAGQI